MPQNTVVVDHVFEVLRQAIRLSGSERESRSGEAADASVLDDAIRQLSAVAHLGGVFHAIDNQVVSLTQSHLEMQARSDHRLLMPLLQARFDTQDYAGWALSVLAWWRSIIKHEWMAPGEPIVLPDTCTFAIVGDWATGVYGAPLCAQEIGARQPTVAIHLGDVYYSGTPAESENRFLRYWRSSPLSRAVNGNHEMYSGGYGYFDTILPMLSQPGSCFAFVNNEWLLVGLDTAYDKRLSDNQLAWIARLVERHPKQRIMLFSHHFPFSVEEEGRTDLIASLQNVLDMRRLCLWYWGHEHRGIAYARHQAHGFWGRCVGHGGMPYRRHDPAGCRDPHFVPLSSDGAPDAMLLDGENPYILGQEGHYGPNGFVWVELEGRQVGETFVTPTKSLIATLSIPPKCAVLQ